VSQFRVITIARQYGSGGSPIAQKVAAHLGWDLLDNTLISRVANAAKVDRKVCHQLDETVDSWMHRLTKRAFGRGAFEGVATAEVFDCDAMERLARQMIEEAARAGNVVIVGRGGQCILQGRPDVFHAFVYAPIDDRMRRVNTKFGPGYATPELIRESDRERAAYVKHHYQCEWCSPHLYDAMFSSTLGDDTVAKAMLAAMRLLPS
jgi:cytidylate kinase